METAKKARGRPRNTDRSPVHVVLEDAVIEALDQACEAEGIYRSQLVNRVLKAHFSRARRKEAA